MIHINQQFKALLIEKKIKRPLMCVLIIGALIGFLSPFGMHSLPLHWSILYWVVTCLIGYMVYMPSIYYGNVFLKKYISIYWICIVISGLAASILMSFIVPIINNLLFYRLVNYSSDFWNIFPKSIAIGGVLTFVLLIQNYLKRQTEELLVQKRLNLDYQQKSETNKEKSLEAFMALLPLEKRGELYCLKMEDHYVKVYTSEGHHLLLMRFKDAIQMLDASGLQIHRSWWVSKPAITSINKNGRRTSLSLINKLDVPVSRTYEKKVKLANIR